ncbi:hypothetical protein MMC19_002181 [Ptychographa xylographoides]|nr:hypothetical protein [Ptychographa xylographoides]
MIINKSTCYCPSCRATPTAVTWRTATATTKSGARYNNVFTFFYSSILATAAVADAGRKDAKRKELDDSIAEAVTELRNVELDQRRRIDALRQARHDLYVLEAQRPQRINLYSNAIYDSSLVNKPRVSGVKQYSPQKIHRRSHQTTAPTRPNDLLLDLPPTKKSELKCEDRDLEWNQTVPFGQLSALSSILKKREKHFVQYDQSLGSKRSSEIASNANTSRPGHETESREEQRALHHLSRDTKIAVETPSPKCLEEFNTTPTEEDTRMTSHSSISGPLSKVTNRLHREGARAQRESLVNGEMATNSLTYKPDIKDRPDNNETRKMACSEQDKSTNNGAFQQRLQKSRFDSTNLSYRSAMSLEALASFRFPLHVDSTIATSGLPSTEVWQCSIDEHKFRQRKLTRRSVSTMKFIYRLLLTSLDVPSCRGLTIHLPNGDAWKLSENHRPQLHTTIEELEAQLQTINEGDVSMFPPEFPQYMRKYYPRSEQQLPRERLRRIFAEGGGIDLLIPKICTNLLLSSASPDVTTYNMLIIQFCNLRQYKMANSVCEAMSECKIQGNEITSAAILRLHAVRSDKHEFTRWAMCKRKKEGIVGSGNPRFKHDRRNGNGSKDLEKSLERARPLQSKHLPCNQETYAALISGWLMLGDLRNALYEYVAMLRSGWKVTRYILEVLLKTAVAHGDWVLGTTIWEEYLRIDGGPDNRAYYWMLQLCEICQKKRWFYDILHDGISGNVLPKDTACHMTPRHFETGPSGIQSLLAMDRAIHELREHIEIPGVPACDYPTPKDASDSPSNLKEMLRQDLHVMEEEKLKLRDLASDPVALKQTVYTFPVKLSYPLTQKKCDGLNRLRPIHRRLNRFNHQPFGIEQ